MSYETVLEQVRNLPEQYLEQVSEYLVSIKAEDIAKSKALAAAFEKSFADAKSRGYASSEKWSRDELYKRR